MLEGDIAVLHARLNDQNGTTASLEARVDAQNVNECAKFLAIDGACNQVLTGGAHSWRIVAGDPEVV